jgi:hypothetical protein
MREAISMHSVVIRGAPLDARCRRAVGNQVQSSAIKCNQVQSKVQSIVIERNQVHSTHDVDEPLATVGAAEGRRHERDGKLVLEDDALHLGGRAHLMRGAISLQSACNQWPPIAISGYIR